MTETRAVMSSDVSSRPPAETHRRRRLLLWAALLAALAVAFAVDGPVMAALRPLHHSPFAELLNSTVRWLGNGKFQVPAVLLLIIAGSFFSRRLLRASGCALLAFLLSGAAASIIKVLVHRPRPWVATSPPGTWSGYLQMSEFQSFPSGDAATTFALAVVIGASYPKLHWLLVAIAIAVAVARVLVGSHHPSDVAAGAILGVAVGHLVTNLANRRGPKEVAPSP